MHVQRYASRGRELSQLGENETTEAAGTTCVNGTNRAAAREAANYQDVCVLKMEVKITRDGLAWVVE